LAWHYLALFCLEVLYEQHYDGGQKMKEMKERSQDCVNQQRPRLAAGGSENLGIDGLTFSPSRDVSFKGLAVGAVGLLLIGALASCPSAISRTKHSKS